MITLGEVSRSVFGAWILARFNPDGLRFFDNTVEAFWRSFWAAAIVLPAYAILLVLRHSGSEIGVGAITAFFVHAIAYVIGWVAFPFLMFYVTQMIDRGQWYCRYMVAYNWSVILQITVMLTVSLFAASGLVSPAIGGAATVITVVFILIYQGFIARTALQVSGPGAAGIVFMDFLLSLMLDGWSAKLLQLQRVVSG